MVHNGVVEIILGLTKRALEAERRVAEARSEASSERFKREMAELQLEHERRFPPNITVNLAGGKS